MHWRFLIAAFVGSVLVGWIVAAYKKRRASSTPKEPR